MIVHTPLSAQAGWVRAGACWIIYRLASALTEPAEFKAKSWRTGLRDRSQPPGSAASGGWGGSLQGDHAEPCQNVCVRDTPRPPPVTHPRVPNRSHPLAWPAPLRAQGCHRPEEAGRLLPNGARGPPWGSSADLWLPPSEASSSPVCSRRFFHGEGLSTGKACPQGRLVTQTSRDHQQLLTPLLHSGSPGWTQIPRPSLATCPPPMPRCVSSMRKGTFVPVYPCAPCTNHSAWPTLKVNRQGCNK